MRSLTRFGAVAALAVAAVVAFGTPSRAAGVQAGSLSCNVSSGWGFVIGSSRAVPVLMRPRTAMARKILRMALAHSATKRKSVRQPSLRFAMTA